MVYLKIKKEKFKDLMYVKAVNSYPYGKQNYLQKVRYLPSQLLAK